MDVQLFNFDLIDVADTEAIAKRCMGKNARKTFVVFQVNNKIEELPAFLGKVLAAAQLDMQQDLLFLSVTPHEKISFSGLCQLFDIQTLIVFGIQPKQLGIRFQLQPYEILQYEGRTFVFVDDLNAIYEERQQGGKRMSGELWRILQTLFLK